MRFSSPLVVKLTYLAVVALLLMPLAWLSKPPTVDLAGVRRNAGGKLAQMRETHGLSQANLGEIDPTSEAIKLATLGMRGVAANILWTKANQYTKVEDWTSLSATLEQITKLQPNFIAVWRFQAWNLSYNVSIEFDDYHDRYFWVIKGINFLREGIPYNEREPRLLYDVGWIISQKIGRSDEHELFRKLFRQDDDFHGARPLAERDNWLVGKQWVRKAEQLVEKYHVPVKGKRPDIFYSYAPMCQISYAEALEDDGRFDDAVRIAWNRAQKDWEAFGQRSLRIGAGYTMRIEDYDRYRQQAVELEKQFNALIPKSLNKQLYQEKIDALSVDERAALKNPASGTDPIQRQLARVARAKLIVTSHELAERLEGAQREKGIELADKLGEVDTLAHLLEESRTSVNYDYWKTRCAAERTDNALEGRRLIHEANVALLDEADPETARARFEQGLARWRKLFDEFPSLEQDGLLGDYIVDATHGYRSVLGQLDEPFPTDYPLQSIVDRNARSWPEDK